MADTIRVRLSGHQSPVELDTSDVTAEELWKRLQADQADVWLRVKEDRGDFVETWVRTSAIIHVELQLDAPISPEVAKKLQRRESNEALGLKGQKYEDRD